MQIVLREGLGAEFLLMGYDHRFGRPKAVKDLQIMCAMVQI